MPSTLQTKILRELAADRVPILAGGNVNVLTAVDAVSREILCMNTKFFATVSIVGVALFCVDKAQSQPPPTSVSAGRTNEQVTNPEAPGGGHGQVWVNTEAGVYHREGSPFYGTTRKGRYMTEQDAIRAGYKRAPKTS